MEKTNAMGNTNPRGKTKMKKNKMSRDEKAREELKKKGAATKMCDFPGCNSPSEIEANLPIINKSEGKPDEYIKDKSLPSKFCLYHNLFALRGLYVPSCKDGNVDKLDVMVPAPMIQVVEAVLEAREMLDRYEAKAKEKKQ